VHKKAAKERHLHRQGISREIHGIPYFPTGK
jgi:hypothetical protein